MRTAALPQAPELTALRAAVRRHKGLAVRELLTEGTWQALASVLHRRTIHSRECIIRQGQTERSIYLIESGSATVYRSQDRGRLQLAVVGAGSVVGEGAFFAATQRSASVETLETTELWELSMEGYQELVAHSPVAALQLCRYLGAVLATRMLSVTGRLSIT